MPPRLILFALPLPMSAVTVANYSDATNLRFDNDPSFIGNPYDWSGVGRVSATPDTGSFSHHREWATLIGENTFISANHFKPSAGDTITFRDGNSLSDPTFDYTVVGGSQVPGTDFWIGYTEGAINPDLKRYAFNTTSADNLSETGLIGATLFLNGDNVSGGPGTLDGTVVGTNQAEAWIEAGSTTIDSTPTITTTLTSSISFDTFVLWRNQAADTANSFTTYEALVQSGDSGSPAFQIVAGDLQIAGLAYSVFTSPGIPGDFDTNSPGDEDRVGSIYSYPGSYTTQINNTLAGIPDPTPEPSTVMLLLLSSVSLFRRNK